MIASLQLINYHQHPHIELPSAGLKKRTAFVSYILQGENHLAIFFLLLIIFFHLFSILTTVSCPLLSSCSLLPPPIYSTHPFLSLSSDRGRPPMGVNMAHQVEAGSSSGTATQHGEQVPKSQFKHMGQILIPLLRTAKLYNCHPYEGLG